MGLAGAPGTTPSSSASTTITAAVTEAARAAVISEQTVDLVPSGIGGGELTSSTQALIIRDGEAALGSRFAGDALAKHVRILHDQSQP